MQSLFLVQINFDALRDLAHPVLTAFILGLRSGRPELNHIISTWTRGQSSLCKVLLYISESVFTAEHLFVLVIAVRSASRHHTGKCFKVHWFGFVRAHIGFFRFLSEAFFTAFDLSFRIIPGRWCFHLFHTVVRVVLTSTWSFVSEPL